MKMKVSKLVVITLVLVACLTEESMAKRLSKKKGKSGFQRGRGLNVSGGGGGGDACVRCCLADEFGHTNSPSNAPTATPAPTGKKAKGSKGGKVNVSSGKGSKSSKSCAERSCDCPVLCASECPAMVGKGKGGGGKVSACKKKETEKKSMACVPSFGCTHVNI